MKKSLSVVLTTAMALSMFSSVAFGKTSADFTDLKDLDAATKAKFDAMISAGIFDGVSDTSFGLNEEMNRAQFAKVAAKILGLTVDESLKASSFSDVKADDAANGYALPYIEALKKAGVTEGYGEGTYNPAGKVTKEQLATFLVRILGKDADAKAKPGVNDSTVSDWAKGYVALALELKLLSNGADGKFGGTTNATRDLLVTGAYEAQQQVPVKAVDKAAINEVKAVGAKKLAVALNGAVDTSKVTFSVLRDGSTASFAASAITWDDKKQTATITLDAKLIEATYSVTIGGVTVDDAKKTASVTASAEKIAKIEITTASDTLPLANNVVIDFKALNQYGELSDKKASNFTVLAGDITPTPVTDKQQVKLDLSGKAKNDRVPLTVIDPDSAVQANKIFTVGEAPLVSKVEVGDLVDGDNKKIDSIEAGKSAYVQYKAYDQYGIEVSVLNDLNSSGKGVTVVIPDSNLTYDTVTNKPFVSNVVGDSNPDLKLEAKSDASAKDITVTLIAQGSGQSVSKVVKVTTPSVPATVDFGSFTDALAKGDANKYIPLVVKNAKGDTMSALDVVNNASKFTVYATGGVITLANPVIETTGDNKGKIHILSVDGKGSGQIVVQLKDKPEVKATYTVTTNDSRYADSISVTSKAADQLINTATSTVKFKTFDQLNGEQKDSVTTNTYTTFKLEKVSGTTGAVTSFTGPGGVNLTTDGQVSAAVANNTAFDQEYTWTASAGSTGTYKVTATLYKKNASNAFVEVGNAISQVQVVDGKSDTLTYSVALDKAVTGNKLLATPKFPNGTINLANTATIISTYGELAKEVKVTAKDGDKVVAVPAGVITSITASNASVVEDNDVQYIVGRAAGTANVTVLFNTAKGQQSANLAVEVTEAAPIVNSIAFSSTSKYVAAGSLNGTYVYDDAIAEELKVVDSYGAEYTDARVATFNDALGVSYYISDIKFASDAGTQDTVSINAAGQLSYTSNTNHILSFKVNAVANGKTTSIEVRTN